MNSDGSNFRLPFASIMLSPEFLVEVDPKAETKGTRDYLWNIYHHSNIIYLFPLLSQVPLQYTNKKYHENLQECRYKVWTADTCGRPIGRVNGLLWDFRYLELHTSSFWTSWEPSDFGCFLEVGFLAFWPFGLLALKMALKANYELEFEICGHCSLCWHSQISN